MGKYSIKELERLSGIKAHTIRIWEKRYGVIDPQRTATNIRFYSDGDLKKIINVSLLNNAGHRISTIAILSDDELIKRVREISELDTNTSVHIDQLITAMIDLDEEKFEDELKFIEKKVGFEDAITEVIFPFLNKIGILWQTGNITPAQEHFISNLIRQKIIIAIGSLPIPPTSSIRIVLFLPEYEQHEIALLFYHYIARKFGFRTYYLGQSVPHEDLKEVCATHRPHILITSLTSTPTPKDLSAYLSKISSDFSMSRVLASGALIHKTSFHYPPNLKVFETVSELREILKQLK